MVKDNDQIRIDIGNLPVWNGVQDKPGFNNLPFVLGINRGVVRLDLTQTDLDSITQGYSSDSYSFITSPPGTSEWGSRLGDLYFQMLANQVGSLAGKTVLEIGAGTVYIGRRVLEELGADHFIACDPAIKAESDLSNLEVVREYFGTALFGERHLDLVLSINNLEHVPDPSGYLMDVRQSLERTDGTLYVVIPDTSRGLESGDIGICVHEHLSYFTPESFTNMLRVCGFELTWLHTQDDTIFATAKPVSAIDAEGINSEDDMAILARFKDRVSYNLDSARRLIDQHRGNSQLAIHGCDVRLNNILGLLGIHQDPTIFLFDGDSNKVDKYLPAFDRPILAASDDQYNSMDAVIVSPLTYYKEITSSIANAHNIPPGRMYPIFPLDNGRGPD